MGQEIANNPDASLPEQMGSWGDLKAAYRLLNEEDVTHKALSQGHWLQTRQQAAMTEARVVLFVQDTTELDYTRQVKTKNLGHIGDGKGRGLMLHSCLAVVPQPGNPEIIGLAAQEVWRPEQIKRGSETRTQRAYRRTQSDVWAEIVEAIGVAIAARNTTNLVSVGDRGSDVFSYIRRATAINWNCLIRVCQDRVIHTVDGVKGRLLSFVRSVPAMASKSIVLRGRDGEPKRSVNLLVAWSKVLIFPPTRGPERRTQPISCWCMRVWEATDSPDALEWVLLTTVPISDTNCALLQVDWYAVRWVIEEYHKCLKTGCAVEQRQLTTAAGLERFLGFLAIVAVKLLQLRTLSRSHPKHLASSVVPLIMLKVLIARLGLLKWELTLAEFWRGLARLGGFIGRKSDGNPGWQTLWRGWSRLQDMSWGASLALEAF
ncbi:IS4 family transposase [Gloeocapsopsis dulcis]